MMKTTLIILAILTFTLINPQDIFAKSQNDAAVDSVMVHKKPLKNLTIIPPHSDILADGTLKKHFAGYSLFDTDNNLLIKVGEVLDIPVTLKIKEGKYIIRLNNEDPTNYFITVTTEHSQEYQIQQ